MAVDVQMTMDTKFAKEFLAAVKRDVRENNRTIGASLAWGGRKICESLAKQTPQMKKGLLRPVVQNPDERWKRDARRAPFGVMKLRQNKPPVFVPIYRTGEYGKVKFFGLDGGMVLVRTSKTTWRMKPTYYYASTQNIAMKSTSVMTNPKRKIPNGGLAKKSWNLLSTKMGRGGFIAFRGIFGLGEVAWTGISTPDPTLKITNRVSYMSKILKGGPNAINEAMAAATRGMVGQMDRGIRGETVAIRNETLRFNRELMKTINKP
jgi:hypothetical protein